MEGVRWMWIYLEEWCEATTYRRKSVTHLCLLHTPDKLDGILNSESNLTSQNLMREQVGCINTENTKW